MAISSVMHDNIVTISMQINYRQSDNVNLKRLMIQFCNFGAAHSYMQLLSLTGCMHVHHGSSKLKNVTSNFLLQLII